MGSLITSLAERRAARRNSTSTETITPPAAPAKRRGRPPRAKRPEPEWLQPGLHPGAAVRLGLALACHHDPAALRPLEQQLLSRYGSRAQPGLPLSSWRSTSTGAALLAGLTDHEAEGRLQQRLGRLTRDPQGQSLATIEELVIALGSGGLDLTAGLMR